MPPRIYMGFWVVFWRVILIFQVNQRWALQLKILVVGFYFQGLYVGLCQSKEGSQLKAGNDPQWVLSLLPLTKAGWVMRE